MHRLLFFVLLCIGIPILSSGQTEYDSKIIGTWTGNIFGGGLSEKSLTVVITSSNIQDGTCEGYSLVNNAGKTTFTGYVMVEADMPIVEAAEPATSKKNGEFHLEFGCYTDYGIDSDLCCGTWVSYDKTIKRSIELRKEN
jgi:hypothetical protein